MDEREYSLMEHLGELRRRLAKALIGVGIIAIGAFTVSDRLLESTVLPLFEDGP